MRAYGVPRIFEAEFCDVYSIKLYHSSKNKRIWKKKARAEEKRFIHRILQVT